MPERVQGPQDLSAETQINQGCPRTGLQSKMDIQPLTEGSVNESSGTTTGQFPVLTNYKAAGKLSGKIALVTGGDSGIGRSVCAYFAKEGADVAVNYLPAEQEDAEETKKFIEKEGRRCTLIPLEQGTEQAAKDLVKQTLSGLGTDHIDILVNNASEQHITHDILDISGDQWERTFRSNIHSCFYITKAAIPHMPKGGSIIITSSEVAYRGSSSLLDYTSTKAAMLGFMRALSQNLAKKGIRVNAVAPGPIWTPLQPASRGKENMDNWSSKETPLGRVGQPAECAPAYVYLACEDSSFVAGQTIHVNGGTVLNG